MASMEHIRKILVPVDFSDSSRRALDYAAKLTRPFGATIDLLHVWEAPTFVPTGSMIGAGIGDVSLFEFVKRGSEDALDKFVAEAAQRGVAVRSARAEAGAPAHAIAEFAKAGGYDLIVIGSHGRTGLSRMLLGSVAENVVRHASCPVLVVRTLPVQPA